MPAISEPVETIAAPYPVRLGSLASWTILWVVFIVAGAILGCAAARAE